MCTFKSAPQLKKKKSSKFSILLFIITHLNYHGNNGSLYYSEIFTIYFLSSKNSYVFLRIL